MKPEIEEQSRPDSEFGLCPVCHQEGRRVDAGKAMWLVCEAHRLAWWGDYGFSAQIEAVRVMDGEAAAEKLDRENRALLAQCREVTPFYWPPTFRARLRKRLAAGNNAVMGWIAEKAWSLAMRLNWWANRRRGYQTAADVLDDDLFADDPQTQRPGPRNGPA